MNVLTIIPARAGSRAVPHKWKAEVGGKLLLQWAIESTEGAKDAGHVWVSTDSREACEFADSLHCQAIRRPPSLANDDTPMVDVLRHALSIFPAMSYAATFDTVLCLQPTCPFRRPQDIDAAVALMKSTNCDSVVSYSSVGACHPQRMVQLAPDGEVFHRPLPFSLDRQKRRQDLEPYYIRSGDVYLTKRSVIESGSMFGKDQRAIIIPKERHCNIDEPCDLILAEWMHKQLEASNG